MPADDERSAADLASELIAADRPSQPVEDEPPPNAAMGPVALLLHPFLRAHRVRLLPLVLVAIVVLVVVAVLT